MEYVEVHEQHLAGIIRLTEAEGWPSFAADPERALRVMTAPGVTSLVAVEEGEVVGFARVLSDGAITSYLAEMVVAPACRGHGVGRALIEEAFRRCGTIRMDLLSEETSEGFYQSLPHRRLAGYRLYPAATAGEGWDE